MISSSWPWHVPIKLSVVSVSCLYLLISKYFSIIFFLLPDSSCPVIIQTISHWSRFKDEATVTRLGVRNSSFPGFICCRSCHVILSLIIIIVFSSSSCQLHLQSRVQHQVQHPPRSDHQHGDQHEVDQRQESSLQVRHQVVTMFEI